VVATRCSNYMGMRSLDASMWRRITTNKYTSDIHARVPGAMTEMDVGGIALPYARMDYYDDPGMVLSLGE
jgi:hypothetical protein